MVQQENNAITLLITVNFILLIQRSIKLQHNLQDIGLCERCYDIQV